MRQTKHLPVQLMDENHNTLRFSGPDTTLCQVQILENDLIRVQMRPDGNWRLNRTWLIGDTPREGKPRDDVSMFRLPPCQTTKTPETVSISTEALALTIHLEDFRIQWSADGQVFAADSPRRAYAYDRGGRAVFHYMQTRPDEYYYGFGEKSGPLNKRGQRLQMKNTDAIGYNAETSDPLYKHWPFYVTWIPSLKIAYGLFYDNLATTVFDMGREIDGYHGYYRMMQAEDGDLDYYFIYGPDLPAVVEKFTALTGRISLPPRWSLGFLGSTMTYTEAPDAQNQLKRFIELCEEHDIPCDLFHLSSGYTTSPEGIRYVFTWNRDKIPNPTQMVAEFHSAGIHLSANIKPYLLTTHPYYEEVKAFTIQSAEADTPELSTLWSGGAFASADGAYLDFTHAKAYEWWQTQVTNQLLNYGIDSTWNDNNEFQIWDDQARCAGFGQPIGLGLIRPVQTLLMARASYEAQRRARPNERPFVLCRAGCPGVQRYAQTWSGDNTTAWHTLKWNIPMGLGMSLSGMANIGHDVGGFFGPKPSAELLVRWVQNGIFSPRFTMHSYNTDGTVNEPWMYPEVLPIIREQFAFRYRLLPYLYSLFHEAAKTGHPILRPLFWHFPDDPHCYEDSFTFMLGPHLLVASVFEEGARTREVYLPAGTGWYEFFSGDYFDGGQTVTVPAPLERIPLFVPEGGILPLGKPMKHVGAEADDLRQLYLFPHRTRGERQFTLIEDDGISWDGPQTQVHIRLIAERGQVKLVIEKQGDFPLVYTSVQCILPEQERRTLSTTIGL